MNNMNDTSKFYYDSSTGIIEGHCFYDTPIEQNKPFFMIKDYFKKHNIKTGE